MMSRFSEQVFGLPVDILSFSGAEDRVLNWARNNESRFVIHANAHVLVSAAQNADFKFVVTNADMVTPDGAPVAYLMRILGKNKIQQRVSGPDLMWSLLQRCGQEGMGVYLYGSTPQTLAALRQRACVAIPGLQIAGAESPPFRALTEVEDAEAVARINASGAGLVFVGLGCPKQEKWMLEHRGRVNAVMLGVGAAFDFHAGTVSRAPLWMREHGLEWLHRFASEPRRLWRRYLVTNTLFVLLAIRQLLLGRAG